MCVKLFHSYGFSVCACVLVGREGGRWVVFEHDGWYTRKAQGRHAAHSHVLALFILVSIHTCMFVLCLHECLYVLFARRRF